MTNDSGLLDDFSGMPEKMRLSCMERVCRSRIVSFISLFSVVTVCICLFNDLTEVNSWFDFCSVTMWLWANSRLLLLSFTSSCSDTRAFSFLFMLGSRLTSISMVCRLSVSVEKSFFFLLDGLFFPES